MSKPVPKEIKKIDDLLAESEESIRRLEKLRSLNAKRGFFERISLHVNKHSNRLLNIALAGGVLAVALARLSDKYTHQVCSLFWPSLCFLVPTIPENEPLLFAD